MFGFIKRTFTNLTKDSRSYPVILDSLRYHEARTPTEFAGFAKAYEEMPWLYASVFQIATTIARLPWQVIKKTPIPEGEREKDGSKYKKEDVTDDDENPLVKLLKHPNKEMTWYDFMESLTSFIELAGNAYAELSENTLQQVTEMYIMRPDRVEVLPGKDNKLVKGYAFKVNGRSSPEEGVVFDAKNVMHIKAFHPLDDWYGLPSVKPAARALSLEDAAFKWNTDFFLNDATPGGLLSTDEKVTREDAEHIEQKWRSRGTGAGNRRKTVLLPFGIKFTKMGTDIKDIEFEGLIKQTCQEQLAAIGVPPAKVGLLEFAKYSNYEIQNRAYYEDTIEPKMMKIQSAINLCIASKFNDKNKKTTYHFQFDLRKKIGENDDTIARRYERYFRMGCATPNEIRKALGLGDDYEEGNDYYIDKRLITVSEMALGFGAEGEGIGVTVVPDEEDISEQPHQEEEEGKPTNKVDDDTLDALEETLKAIGVKTKEVTKIVSGVDARI